MKLLLMYIFLISSCSNIEHDDARSNGSLAEDVSPLILNTKVDLLTIQAETLKNCSMKVVSFKNPIINFHTRKVKGETYDIRICDAYTKRVPVFTNKIKISSSLINKLKKECSKGVDESCLNSGRYLLNTGNLAEGFRLLKIGCKNKEANSCMYLAQHHNSLKQSVVGEKYLIKACNLREATACSYLGFQNSLNKNKYYHKRACRLKHGFSCYMLGEEYMKKGMMTKKAMTYFKAACDIHPNYCSQLVKNFSDRKNFDKAIQYLKGPCDKGLVSGCYNLACVYSIQGKKQSSIKSLKRAQELGFNRYKRMEKDNSLDNIKNMIEYKRLLKKMKDKSNAK
ncbi:MAG: hypothetical protein DRQ88_01220 [Epsilonproteobacteria bacterium]|nr:MAG: hypothetical protein DRQ89_05290 [Campylobacterota bacterium]RLA67914.1 MAG: hypothetical protein DRQ88_01220 [Campylobacterota bacterium]